MYGVRFVEDHELPKAWVLVRTGERMRLFVRRSAVTPEVLEQAWAAYRQVAAHREQESQPDLPFARAL